MSAEVMLETRGLHKRYGMLDAVNDVSLTVLRGERRAVIGPNGAGKTTLLNLVGGRTPVTAGQVLFRKKDVTKTPEHRRARAGIGKTFQRSNLFPSLTVRENVGLAVQQRMRVAHRLFRPAHSLVEVNERSAALLERVALSGRSDAQANELSHGEQRQLELALALALEPDLLLLDEPAAGMSAAERANLVDLIRQLDERLTVLLIEHDMDIVFELSTHIAVMQSGSVIADGAPEEIARSPEVQEAYLGKDTPEVFEG